MEIERRREIFILAGAMKRTLILAVTLSLGVSATAHAQVSLSVGTQPNPQVSAETSAQVNSPANTVFSAVAPVAVPCPFGVSLSANLTAFGCASDPLGAPTYQFPVAGATAVITAPIGSIGANAQTVTPNAASGAAGAGGGVSSRTGCLGAIPSTAGGADAGDLFGGIGSC